MKTVSYPWLQASFANMDNSFHDKPYHAYLCCGMRGLGKTNLITNLSKTWLGVDKLDNYPNYHSISVASDKKNIGVDQIRHMQDKMQLIGHQQSLKIVAIFNAQLMTPQASNAMLKILEEPPESLVFLISSDSKFKLLPTIISRCQVWHIKTPTESESISWLSKLSSKPLKDIKTAVKWCFNSPLDALELLNRSDFNDLINLLNKLRQPIVSECIGMVESWIKNDWGYLIVTYILNQIHFWVKNNLRQSDKLIDAIVLQQETGAVIKMWNTNVNKTVLLQNLLFNWICWRKNIPLAQHQKNTKLKKLHATNNY